MEFNGVKRIVKTEITSFVGKQMELGIIRLSKLRQTEKNNLFLYTKSRL
jgi:hypothetical protein